MLLVAALLALAPPPTVTYREELTVLGATSTSTSVCVDRRCRHERGGFGVYPAVTLFVDGDAFWAQTPDESAAAPLTNFRAYDRNWFVDVPDAPVTFAPAPTAGRTPPPLANAETTLWVARVENGTIEVWVRPDLPQTAAQFADGLARRRPGFPIVEALRALPGRPIRITQDIRGPGVMPLTTELTLTAMTASTSTPPSFAPSPRATRIDESALLPALLKAARPAGAAAKTVENGDGGSAAEAKNVETAGPPPGWRALGDVVDVGADAVGVSEDSVTLCAGDSCRVRPFASGEERVIPLPCPGAATNARFSPQAGYIALRCPYDAGRARVFVVSVASGAARRVDVDADLGIVVDDRGRIRALAQQGSRVRLFDEQPDGRMVEHDIDYDASRAAPDLGHGALLFSTHELGGPREAAFFLEGGQVRRVDVAGGPLINGACLWISRMSGGYDRVSATATEPVKDELRGATMNDGVLGEIRPWGDRGLLVHYERRVFLYDRELHAGESFAKTIQDEVYATPSGKRLVMVRSAGVGRTTLFMRDVGAAVERTRPCTER